MTNASENNKNYTAHPSFYEAFRFWLLLGFISFGIAIHHHMTMESPRMLFLHYWGKGNA